MSALLEYGWRTGSVEIMRDGFHGQVERWWCDGIDDGWRWRGFHAEDIARSATPISELMPFDEAKRHVEEWIDAQIEKAKGLAVYQFAGLEPQPEPEPQPDTVPVVDPVVMDRAREEPF